MPALHVILGPQTAKKLDEIAQVTEESKTALVQRLIREEWDRQREKMPPIIATGPAPVLFEGSARFDGTDRERTFIASSDDRLV